MLSPHIFLLGLLFAHQAFDVPEFSSPDMIDRLEIWPGEQELPLPIKESMRNVPVFRRAVKTWTGWEMSPDQALSYGTMTGWIKRIGVLTGFFMVIAYNLRYNAANEFDQSGKVAPMPALGPRTRAPADPARQAM